MEAGQAGTWSFDSKPTSPCTVLQGARRLPIPPTSFSLLEKTSGPAQPWALPPETICKFWPQPAGPLPGRAQEGSSSYDWMPLPAAPLQSKTLAKSPHTLCFSASAQALALKRGYMTKGRSVQTGPVFQACRVHSLAGQSHTPGRALLPQDSGLPPRGLCGPSWHPHPPSAKCLLKEGAWRCPHVTSEDVFHRGSPLSRSHGS